MLDAYNYALYQLGDGTYQPLVYYNYNDADKTRIDVSSVTSYGLPEGKTAADYDGSSVSFGKRDNVQAVTNLNSICGGLVGTDAKTFGHGAVVNRYVVPIGSAITSGSDGHIKNSYGFAF